MIQGKERLELDIQGMCGGYTLWVTFSRWGLNFFKLECQAYQGHAYGHTKPSFLSWMHLRNSHTRQAFKACGSERGEDGALKGQVVEALTQPGAIRPGWCGERGFVLLGSGSQKGPFIWGGKVPVWLQFC